MQRYLIARGNYEHVDEQFFVFKGSIPVTLHNIRSTIKSLLRRLNLEDSAYSVQSLRSGRASDLLKWGFTVEQIKIVGQWKSNAVYKYLKY